MCFRPPSAAKGSRICKECRMINEDPEATVCENCGAELEGIGAKAPVPPPGQTGAAVPPKAPPAPPKAPPKPPVKSG